MDRNQQQQDLINSFREVTGATEESSRFFLESANWNLEFAMTSYYEGSGRHEGIEGLNQFGTTQREEYAYQPEIVTVPDESADSSEEAERSTPPVEIVEATAPSPSTAAASKKRFATIFTMRSAHESSSDDEEGQAYFAGGSQHSGQQIVGPSRGSHEIINDIFRSVRDQGGVEAASYNPGRSGAFSGHGYRLGQTPDDSQVVYGSQGGVLGREVVLRLWRDGFSLDDGPLRFYNDPEQGEFLSRIRRGNIPPELVSQSGEGSIHLNLEDHRNENFILPRPTAFPGQGHVLGSEEVEESPITVEGEEVEAEPEPEKVDITADLSQPTTSIQVRLPDGERLQFTLNLTHTVGDLRIAVTESLPRELSGPFSLMTTFPSKELTDDEQTLAEADLLNTCLMLKKKLGLVIRMPKLTRKPTTLNADLVQSPGQASLGGNRQSNTPNRNNDQKRLLRKRKSKPAANKFKSGTPHSKADN